MLLTVGEAIAIQRSGVLGSRYLLQILSAMGIL